MSFRPLCLLGLALICSLSCCSAKEPLERLISDLDQPGRREKAIDALLLQLKRTPPPEAPQIRQRVIDALSEAYREDHARGKIVGALAFLEAPARQVYVAAVKDAGRGGRYYGAAVRAAQALGELGLGQEVPTLLAALSDSLRGPPTDGGSFLERALIQSLGELADGRAIPLLTQVLGGDPARQDISLNRLAARALGQIGGRQAASALVSALATGSYGLLLYEEARRALCQIGPAAREPLLAGAGRRGAQGIPAPYAWAALRVLADLGSATLAEHVAQLSRPADPEGYQLAAAETLLRLGASAGRATLLTLLGDTRHPLTVRRRAAELLGWYGAPGSLSAALLASCPAADPAQQVLCWGVALAFSRSAAGPELAQLDSLIAHSETAEVTREYLQKYRPRLVLAAECADELSCYRQALDAADWRTQERAVLETSRLGQGLSPPERDRLALDLARHYPDAHAQVRQALLVALEQLTARENSGASSGKIAQKLLAPEPTVPAAGGEASQSWAFCLSRRLSAADELARQR